jgi:hypothetical protein
MALFALLGRLSYLFEPFGTDSSMFIYMGKLVTAGGRVGVELVDNKFPTVGLLTSGAWRLFGSCWSAYVILQTLMAVIAAALLARSVRRCFGAHAAIPTALFALIYFNFSLAVGGGFQLETLQAFFATIAAAATLPALFEDDGRDSFLVGLSAGTAMMLKPSSIAVLAAFALAAMVHWRLRPGRLVTHAALALAGLAIPAAVSFVYFTQADLIKELPAIWRQVASYAAHSRLEWWDIGKWIVVIAIAAFPFLVRGVIFRRKEDSAAVFYPPAALVFGLTWLVIEVAGVVAQKRMYPYHFFVLTPPIALLFGMLPRSDRLLPLVAALGLPLLLSLYGGWCLFDKFNPRSDRLATSDYFATHAAPGDAVWQDYMMRLLVETDLQPGSRYCTTFLWANDENAAHFYSQALLRDLAARRPRYIVLPTALDAYIAKICAQLRELELDPIRRANYIEAWAALRSYVSENYVAEAQVGHETIFRRLGASSATPNTGRSVRLLFIGGDRTRRG